MNYVKNLILRAMSAPVVKKAAEAFIFAAVPLLIAAVETGGVSGVTTAVILAACAAGLRAAYHVISMGAKRKLA